MLYEVPPTAGLPLRASALGSFGGGLEDKLATFLSVPGVQVECSGTAALVIILSYLKSKSDRKVVVVPAYTCPLVAIAVAQAGLELVVCDNEPDSYYFDLEKLTDICNKRSPLAIIPTHFAGLVAPMEPIVEIARGSDAYIIEDAAQSLGARRDGMYGGTIGDFGFFSLSCGKGLTIYQGGFWYARDDSTRRELRVFREQLVSKNLLLETLRVAELLGYGLLYNPTALHWAYGNPLRHWIERKDYAKAVGDLFPLKTELCEVGWYRKAIAAAGLPHLREYLSECRDRGTRRAAKLALLPGLKVLVEEPGAESNWPFITLLFDRADHCSAALDELWTKGVGVTKLFVSPLTGYDYLRSIVPVADVPNADAFASRMMTISNSAWLSDEAFQTIIDTLSVIVGHSVSQLDHVPA